MKKTLANLQDAFVDQLKGLYDAEIKIEKALGNCIANATSNSLKNELKKYSDSTEIKIEKIETMFDELDLKAAKRDNVIMDKMLEDLDHMLQFTSIGQVRDALIISCIQSINHFKISGFGTGHAIAVELDKYTIATLLQEILTMEKLADKALTKIAINEVNIKAAEVQAT
jgi:ferritin-like metal-binding protein YciE